MSSLKIRDKKHKLEEKLFVKEYLIKRNKKEAYAYIEMLNLTMSMNRYVLFLDKVEAMHAMLLDIHIICNPLLIITQQRLLS